VNRARLSVFAFFAPLREIFMSVAEFFFTQRRKERKDASKLTGNVIFNANILAPTGFFALFLLEFS